MAGTNVNDILLTAGQNQAIEPSVLPTPQLIAVSNLRLRKGARWGKRFGHTALSTATLGTGAGNLRAIGGGKGGALTCFALVDDRCSVYDQAAGSFVVPPPLISPLQRVAGAASGWQPDTSFFPVPQQSLKFQTVTPCATCYAFGYLWTVISYTDPVGGVDKKLRLVATEPSDQTVVRVDDFAPTAAGFGGNSYPKLTLVGSTLVLTYVLAGAGTGAVTGRTLAGIGSAWSAEVVIVAALPGLTYDASSYSATRFIVAVASTVASSVNLLSTALAITNTQAIADVSGNPLTHISCVGSSAVAAGEIYVGYACGATPADKVRVFTANLAGTVGTATLSANTKKPLLALLTGGGVRAVYGSTVTAGTFGQFLFRDVTAAAAAAGPQLTQTCAYPISNPFTIGGVVYVWTKTETSGVSYATLLRLPPPSVFVTGNISCPIEMSVQDYLVSSGQGLIELDLRGVPTIAQLGATAIYAVPVPTLYAVSSAVATGHDFRILQARHYTTAAQLRSVNALYADSSVFLPLGTLTRVDDRGTIEEGFAHAPTITGLVAANGAGTMSLGDYYYTAVYKSRNSNGRFEVSAPAAPVKVTLTGVQNQVTVSVLSLGMTARPNTTIEIYRTLANGQTYYLAAIIDSGTGVIAQLDQLSDAIASVQQALYTQVGQTLPNAFPPPARFGCIGGGRVILGGGMRPDIVQTSKLMLGDQSPSFADSDAFRVVLPAPCTGAAWMDVMCLFTAEGIYIASGDGPDDAGVGDFGNLTRMPYELGCIEPRSVVVVDDGCFFQTARGLYLLPRGFGAPVPAGDNVQDSLAQFPTITGVAVLTKPTEQTVHWSCSDPNGFFGQRIVYDLVNKAWAIDNYSAGIFSAPCGVGQWAGSEVAIFQTTLASPMPLAVTNNSFADAGAAIQVSLATGDLRPFGVLSEGTISKIQLLAELRSACTLTTFKGTEFGGDTLATRAFALGPTDYSVGEVTVTELNLGASSFREAMRVRVAFGETSTTEGLAFIAIAVEHEQGEGLKRASPLSRVT